MVSFGLAVVNADAATPTPPIAAPLCASVLPPIDKELMQPHFLNVAGALAGLGLLETDVVEDILQEIPGDDMEARDIRRAIDAYRIEFDKHDSGEYSHVFEYSDYPPSVLENFAARLLGYLDALEYVYEDDAATRNAFARIEPDRMALQRFTGVGLMASTCPSAPEEAPAAEGQAAKAEPILAF